MHTKFNNSKQVNKLCDIASVGNNKQFSNQFIGDVEYRILSSFVESGLEKMSLSNIASSVGINVRKAWQIIQRLSKRGFVEKVSRGIYKITELGKKAIASLPIRKLSRNTEASVGKAVGTSVASGVCLNGGGFAKPVSLGLFLDNVRYYAFGEYHQLGRERLLSLSGLSSADFVSYFEVSFPVANVFLDSVVVVYSNLEDFERFGKPTARVEVRPPKSFVKRNGVASTIRFAKHELIKAFKAIATALHHILTPRELEKLFLWLVFVWGLKHLCM